MRVAAVNCKLPFDVAFAADEGFVLAWIVADGESRGEKFSWNSMSWMKRNG